MFLFFHINAIGRPKKWNVPASDTYYWPRMLQIAWQQYNDSGEIQTAEDFIIKPEGFDIPVETEQYTKITPVMAYEEGVPLSFFCPFCG